MKWLAVFALLTIPVTAYAPLEKKYCPTETHWHYHIPDELQIDMELFTFKQLEELRLRGQMCYDDPHCLEIWPISVDLWITILHASYIQKLRVERIADEGGTFERTMPRVRLAKTPWWEDAFERASWEAFESEAF
jgi:hypothetical protein